VQYWVLDMMYSCTVLVLHLGVLSVHTFILGIYTVFYLLGTVHCISHTICYIWLLYAVYCLCYCTLSTILRCFLYCTVYCTQYTVFVHGTVHLYMAEKEGISTIYTIFTVKSLFNYRVWCGEPRITLSKKSELDNSLSLCKRLKRKC